MQTLKLSLMMIMMKKKKEERRRKWRKKIGREKGGKGRRGERQREKKSKKKIAIMLKQTSAWRRSTRESPSQISYNTGLGPEDNSPILCSVSF